MDALRTRRIRLIILATTNLLLWSGLAVSMGLLAGDAVDIGVESLVRRTQATAVAVFENSPTRKADQTPALAWNGGPAGPQALASEAVQATPVAGAASLQAAGATVVPLSSAGSADPPFGTDQPAADLAGTPLLLADPPLGDLSLIDTEMSRSAASRPVQIRFSEDALNQEISGLLRVRPELPYRNVVIGLGRDLITVTAEIDLMGLRISTEVVGAVMAHDCRLEARSSQILVNGNPTTGAVRQSIEKLLQDAMAWYRSDYPLCLEQVVIEEGRVTAYGIRK